MRAVVEGVRVVSTEARDWEKNGRTGTIRTAYIVGDGGSPEALTVWAPNEGSGDEDLWPEVLKLDGTGETVDLVVDFGARAFRGEGQLRISLRSIRQSADALSAVG